MIVRRHLSSNYTVIDNAVLQDGRLSWKATGMLAYLLSLPEDWRVHIADLQMRKTEGRTATESGFRELREAGYISIEKIRAGDGRLSSICHVWDTRQNDPDISGSAEERETRGPEEPEPGDPGALVSTQVEITQDRSDKELFDALWDWLSDAFGKPTKSQNALRARIVRSLLDEGATPQELARRALSWPAHFGEATLTETALEKHWHRLGLPPRKASRAQTARLERAEDRAGLAESLE